MGMFDKFFNKNKSKTVEEMNVQEILEKIQQNKKNIANKTKTERDNNKQDYATTLNGYSPKKNEELDKNNNKLELQNQKLLEALQRRSFIKNNVIKKIQEDPILNSEYKQYTKLFKADKYFDKKHDKYFDKKHDNFYTKYANKSSTEILLEINKLSDKMYSDQTNKIDRLYAVLKTRALDPDNKEMKQLIKTDDLQLIKDQHENEIDDLKLKKDQHKMETKGFETKRKILEGDLKLIQDNLFY
jgi:hypothetical protein